MGNFKINKVTRNVLQTSNMLLDICLTIQSGMVKRPEFPAAAIAIITQKFTVEINKLKAELPSPHELALAAIAPNVEQKRFTDYKTKIKKNNEKKELEFKKKRSNFIQSRIDSLSLQMNHSISSINIMYENQKRDFDLFIETIKNDYLDKDSRKSGNKIWSDTLEGADGGGYVRVNSICNNLEYCINELIDIFSQIKKYIIQMTAKSVTPSSVGSCTPNPIYTLEDFIIDLNTLLTIMQRTVTLLTNINKYIEELNLTKFSKISKILKEHNVDDILQAPGDSGVSSLLSTCENMNNTYNDSLLELDNAKSAMKKQLESQYQEVPEGDFKHYKKIRLDNDFNILGFDYYYQFTELRKELLETKRANKYNVTNVINQILKQNTSADPEKIWFKFEPSDKISDDTETSQSVISKNVTGRVINSTISNINGSIIELSDGKQYIVDNIPKSGDIIKLPDGIYVNIE